MKMHLQPALAWAWIGVAVLLIGTTFLLTAMNRKNPSPELHRNWLRLKTWWLIAAVLFVAMLVGSAGVTVLFLLVSILALREFCELRTDALSMPASCSVLAFAACWHYLFMAAATTTAHPAMIDAVETVVVLAALGAATRSLGKALLGGAAFLFAVCGLGTAVRLAQLLSEGAAADNGLGALFLLLLITALNDVAQYAWGKALGRRKILPRISPEKTWAGLLGGVLTSAVLAGCLAPLLTPLGWRLGAVAGLVIGGGGFLGDLLESAYKRSVGAKDSGVALPGHGGVLDRIDSLCLSAPLFYGWLKLVS